MKERPIIFSGPMVRAILAGRKTQTRRVVQPQPEFHGVKSWSRGKWCEACDRWDFYVPTTGGVYTSSTTNGEWRCPYGVPGARLWVRETWAGDDMKGFVYRADHPGADLKRGDLDDGDQAIRSWKPSIHMSRWASRLTLEVKSVRVERVQEISEADAKAEGLRERDDPGHQAFARDEFARYWNVINAKRGYGWDANPWVWVIGFEVVRDAGEG